MKKGYYEAVVDSRVANELSNPLDRALKARKVQLVKTSMGGHAAEVTWFHIYAPADFAGAEDLDLQLWARWVPSSPDAVPPDSLRDKSGAPPVVQVYDAVRDVAKPFAFGSGLGLIVVLYLLLNRK